MLRFEAELGGACSQRLHDIWEEEPLQDLRCLAKQRDGVVGAAMFAWLPCFQDPYCRNVNSGN